MKANRYIKRIFRLAALLPGLMLCGCVNDSADCPIDETPDKGVYLRFDIVTRGTSYSRSRAITMPSDDELQEGTIAENYIDVPNMLFMLFDADQNFLSPISPAVAPEEGSNYTRYQVNTVLYNPYFTDPASDEITFYVLVLANYSKYDTKDLVYGKTLQQMFGDGSPSFAIPTQGGWWYPHIATDDLSNSPQYIPMSGLQRFTVKVSDLDASTVDSPLNISLNDHSKDINMLRALAKIEVVDRINATGTGDAFVQPDKESRAYIEKVELYGYYNRGSLLPSYQQWVTETQYVSGVNIPSTATYQNPKAFEGTGGSSPRDFGEDADATAKRKADGKDECSVFSVYVPEYKVPTTDDLTTSTPIVPAWIQVTVYDSQYPGTDKSKLYHMKLAEYSNGSSGTTNIPLLRNNIYRYEIESVSSSVINLTWTVCAMDEADEITIPSFE